MGLMKAKTSLSLVIPALFPAMAWASSTASSASREPNLFILLEKAVGGGIAVLIAFALSSLLIQCAGVAVCFAVIALARRQHGPKRVYRPLPGQPNRSNQRSQIQKAGKGGESGGLEDLLSPSEVAPQGRPPDPTEDLLRIPITLGAIGALGLGAISFLLLGGEATFLIFKSVAWLSLYLSPIPLLLYTVTALYSRWKRHRSDS
jgi:hypothetical protein